MYAYVCVCMCIYVHVCACMCMYVYVRVCTRRLPLSRPCLSEMEVGVRGFAHPASLLTDGIGTPEPNQSPR